ncbi:IclR family transcriptional regulator [Saccharopolyspora taberi]|uniref:Allantoin degradation transcriptional regulator AllR n=1 Tax=Saccharopolyspora taberi TaxID=60895 RepID=A0ABN3VKC3_9PSEU
MPESSEAAPRGDMVGKALRLLVLLGESPRGIGLSELARRAGYPVSTTHRLLNSIAREEFAVLDEQRRWNLGLRMFELGQRVLHARGFTEIATPVLERVTRETGESTLMAVLDGDSQLYVHYVEGTQQVQITGEPGQRGPLHCTSMGKCLVAFQPSQSREDLLSRIELPGLGPRTITERDRFRAEIEQVRRDGYAIADEEHEAGILAIGVPVLNPSGIAVAALSSAAPAFRSSLDELRAHLPHLRAAARELAIGLPRR